MVTLTGKGEKKKRAGGMFLSWLPPYLCGRNSHGSPVGGMGAGQMGVWPALYGRKHQLSSQPHNSSEQRKSQAGRGMGLLSSAAAFLQNWGAREALRVCSEPSRTDREWTDRVPRPDCIQKPKH